MAAQARRMAEETMMPLEVERGVHSRRSMLLGRKVRRQPSNQIRSIGTLPLRSLGNSLKQNQQNHRRVPQPRLRRTHTGSRHSTVRRPQSMCPLRQHNHWRRRHPSHSRMSRRGCTGSGQSRTRTSTRVERFPPRRPRSSSRGLDRGTPSRSRQLLPPPSSATRQLEADRRLCATSPSRWSFG